MVFGLLNSSNNNDNPAKSGVLKGCAKMSWQELPSQSVAFKFDDKFAMFETWSTKKWLFGVLLHEKTCCVYMFLPRFWGATICLKKVAFAMVWKDGQAEIAFKNKNVSQVGQSRKQVNPVFSTQQQKVPARFQGCSGFSGRAFSCHQSTATEIPNTFADGN